MGAEDTGKSLFIKQLTSFTSVTTAFFEDDAFDDIGSYTTSEGGRFEIAFNEVKARVFRSWDTTNLRSTALPPVFGFTDAAIIFFNHNDVKSRSRIRGWLELIKRSCHEMHRTPLPILVIGTRASEMHPDAPQPNFGAYKGLKITNIDVLSSNPDFMPLKALQLLVPDLFEANHPLSLIPVFDGDKYLVLVPTPQSKDLIKTLFIKDGETHIIGRKSMHTGCLRNKLELDMALALSVEHLEVHFYTSPETDQVKTARIKRLGTTVVRLEDRSEDDNSLVSTDLHRGEEGILHPGRGIIHLFAGAENRMTYKLMTLSVYLCSLENHSPMDIITPFLDLQGIQMQTTELLLLELKKYKLLLAEARARSNEGAMTRMLPAVDEDGSDGDEDDELTKLGTNLGNHLSFLESAGEDIYGDHRTQPF
jgi:hypothetical protein